MALLSDAKTSRLRVFISYSRADEAFADELMLGLEDRGYDVSLDRHSLREGEAWQERLGALIAESATVIFILSPDSARSSICQWEVEQAHRLAKRVIPVLFRGLHESPLGRQPDGSAWPPGVPAAPPLLAKLNYVRFDTLDEGKPRSFMMAVRGLVRAIETDLDWLREHARLLTKAQEWVEGSRPPNRLLSGNDIAEAKALVKARKPSAPQMLPIQLDFIQSSEEHQATKDDAARTELAERERLVRKAEAAQAREEQARVAREAAQAEAAAAAYREAAQSRKVARRTLAGLGVALALTVIASGIGFYAFHKKEEAELARSQEQLQLKVANEARELSERAVQAKNTALLELQQNQSRSIADEAARALKGGDPGTAILFALEALPEQDSTDAERKNWPHWGPAEQVLLDAQRELVIPEVLSGHTGSVNALAIGTVIVSGAADKTARVWNLEDGAHKHTLSGHSDSILAVAASTNLEYIVTGSADHTARVWDVQTGALISVLNGHSGPVTAVAILPNKRRIATASSDGSLILWHPETGMPIIRLNEHAAPITSLAVSENELFIASGSLDKTVRIWSTEREASLHILRVGAVKSMAFEPEANILAAATDKTIQMWATGTGTLVRELPSLSNEVMTFSLQSLEKIDALASDGSYWTWMENNWTRSLHYSFNPAAEVKSALIHRDGLITGSTDQNLRIFSRREDQLLLKLIAPQKSALSIIASPNGDRLVTVNGFRPVVSVWRRDGSKLLDLEEQKTAVWSVGITPDGQKLITGADDGTAKVWDAYSGQELLAVKPHGAAINAVAVSPDGGRFLTGSADGSAKVIRIADGAELLTLSGHSDSVRAVSISPDGRYIATGSKDHAAHLWDSKTGSHVRMLSGHAGDIRSIAISPDSRRIITGSEDQTARVWDADTGAHLYTVKGHRFAVHGVAITADGRRFASGSDGGDVRIWDLESGRFILAFTLDRNYANLGISSLAALPDSDHIAVGYLPWETEWAPIIFPHNKVLYSEARRRVERCLGLGERLQAFLSPRVPDWCISNNKWPFTKSHIGMEIERFLAAVGPTGLQYARPLIQRHTEVHPDSAQPLAAIFLKLGKERATHQPEVAEEYFGIAEQLNPDLLEEIKKQSAVGHISRAETLLEKGKLKLGEVEIERAKSLDPSLSIRANEALARYYWTLGSDTYKKLNNEELAEKFYKTALNQAPSLSDAIKKSWAYDLVLVGGNLVRKGAVADAVLYFERALKLDPDGVDNARDTKAHAHMDRGVEFLEQDKDSLAFNEFAAAIADRPELSLETNKRIGYRLLERAEAKLAERAHSAAAQLFAEATALSHALGSRIANVYHKVGWAAWQRGELEEAFDYFSSALRYEPKSLLSLRDRGRVLVRRKEFDRAIADFTRLIEIEPTSEHYRFRGNAHSGNGEYDAAVADLRKSIELEPKHNGDAYQDLASIRYDFKRYDEALEDVKRALISQPQSAEAHALKGLIFHAQGQEEKALDQYKEALVRQPLLSHVHNNKAVISRNRGHYEEALLGFTLAVMLERNVVFLRNRCFILAIIGSSLGSALEDCNEAVRQDPSSAISLRNRGFVYLEMNRLDEALADFDAALVVESKDAEAYIGRSLVLRRRGDLAGSDAARASAANIKSEVETVIRNHGFR